MTDQIAPGHTRARGPAAAARRWRSRRARSRSIARYHRNLGQLARSPYGWAGWLDLLALAADAAAAASHEDPDTVIWAETGDLVRAAAAAERGLVLVHVRGGTGADGAAWNASPLCAVLWESLARADNDAAAALALGALSAAIEGTQAARPEAARALNALAAARRCAAAARPRAPRGGTPGPPGPGTAVCDNTSAGVIIRGADGRYLVFDRHTFPPGVAPCAGHVDEHGGFEPAAVAEVAEELGLTVTSLREATGGWRDNRCRRHPGPAGVTGHEWRVYDATVSGDLRPSPRETRNARWLAAAELQALADRTAAYAYGRLTSAEFAEDPGIEPVWVQWLTDTGVIDATVPDLAAIDQIAAGSPDGEPR